MNKIGISLLILALPLTTVSFAQFGYELKAATRFDKFVMKSDVKWAAYTSDTVRFPLSNLSVYLRKRFNDGEIKTTPSIEPRSAAAQNVQFKTKAEVLAALPPDVHFDSLAIDLVDVVQILYVEDGSLKTHNAWVSPKYSVITPEGTRLGFANYFSTAFVERPSSRKRSSKFLPLGKTSLQIKLDSIPSERMLKATFGRNLLESIWPSVMSGENKLVFTRTNLPVSGTTLLQNGISDSVAVPVYDSLGNRVGTKTMAGTVPLASIKTMMVEQEWFYDKKRNKLYSYILSASLVTDDRPSITSDDRSRFRIIFN